MPMAFSSDRLNTSKSRHENVELERRGGRGGGGPAAVELGVHFLPIFAIPTCKGYECYGSDGEDGEGSATVPGEGYLGTLEVGAADRQVEKRKQNDANQASETTQEEADL